MVLYAHNYPGFPKQPLDEHLLNVASQAEIYGRQFNMGVTARLVSILHDMGKASQDFQKYRLGLGLLPGEYTHKGIDHSTAGAQYIQSFSNFDKQIRDFLSIVIASHHSNLIDCVEMMPPNTDLLEKRFNKNFTKTYYNEAKLWMESTLLKDISVRYDLLRGSSTEIQATLQSFPSKGMLRNFYFGCLTRMVLSCLVDADHKDTREAGHGGKSRLDEMKIPDWKSLINKLDRKIKSLPPIQDPCLANLRKTIYKDCSTPKFTKPGIYTLTAPTGSGKTLSSLRLALEFAHKNNLRQIFMFAPFISVVGQNAEVVSSVLGKENVVEHHSNVIQDIEPESLDQSDGNYRFPKSIPWDKSIIFTTFNKFEDAFFYNSMNSLERMHSFANSVLVFDEVQKIPFSFINMFNGSLNFLKSSCNSSIILTTATQPELSHKDFGCPLNLDEEIITSKYELSPKKRYTIVGLTRPKYITTNVEFAHKMLEMGESKGSVLGIVNTRRSAYEIFNVLQRLSNANNFSIFHLSTNMYPKHRKETIANVKQCLKDGKPVLCISTQLIEAGVDIDFPVVIKDLGGIPSIIQAAGRCNREMKGEGTLIISHLNEEHFLPSFILDEQNVSRSSIAFDDSKITWEDLESVYYKKYLKKYMEHDFCDKLKKFPMGKDKDMFRVLCGKDIRTESIHRDWLTQPFASCYKEFCAIDSYRNQHIVIMDPMAHINEQSPLSTLQLYTVDVSKRDFNKIKKFLVPSENRAFWMLEDSSEKYDPDCGLLLYNTR